MFMNKASHPDSPFKFLDSYSKDDREIFFGRDAEIEELYDRVFETNLILLYGASGTGKTSLIDCGLANRFESTDWVPITIRRQEHLVHSLQEAIAEKARNPLAADWPIRRKLRSLYLDYFKPIYLIFDQFEEVFIMGSELEQVEFFEIIKELLQTDLQLKVLLSMREEYIAYLSDFEQVIPSLFDNRMRIEKMTRVHLGEVIGGTAESFAIEIDDAEHTINLIIDNIMDQRDGVELGNLQIYLDKLYRNDWERRGQQERPIRFDKPLIQATRQLKDVLSDFLDEQLQLIERELEEDGIPGKGIPQDILFELVTEDATKRSLTGDSLKEQMYQRKAVDATVVDYCLKRLNELRIVRVLGGNS